MKVDSLLDKFRVGFDSLYFTESNQISTLFVIQFYSFIEAISYNSGLRISNSYKNNSFIISCSCKNDWFSMSYASIRNTSGLLIIRLLTGCS